MKKITILMILMMTSTLSFSQSLGPNLVSNGDFESPSTAPWYSGGGAGLNIVEIAGNRLNQKDVTVAGTPFSVNISQVIILESGKTYRLTYDAYTNLASRPIVVGLGQSAGPFAAVVVTQTITNTSTTYNHDLTINYGNAVTDRVIFDIGAATGTVFLDNVSVREILPVSPPINDVTGDVYINDGTFATGDFTTAAGQDIATNDGSASEPFATLDYALARSTQAPGDVIYIDAGTYSWESTHALTDSGTLANPITIQGKGNNETNITTTASSSTSAGLHFTTGAHWVVKDLNWTATAARAVWVDGVAGITLDNCTINMTSTSTIQSITINNAAGELTIKNSRLTRSNTAFHMVEVVEGTTLIMQDNRVSFSALVPSGDASSVLLRTNASSLFIIERNKFVNGGYGIGNVAGTAGPVNASSIIKNNFFNSFWGIVTTIVQGLTVHNNSFYTNREGIYGINAGSLTNWDIRNNILYTHGSSRSCILSGSATSHPAIMDYNHYYSPDTGAGRTTLSGSILSFTQWQNAAGGPWEQNGQGGNAASFNPLYVDAANGDLNLQPGSPAINAGTDVGITDDINGNSRPQSGAFDMGAAEFVVALNDATLSALEVDNVSVPSFSPLTLNYNLFAEFGTTPQITLATPTNPAATVEINQSLALPLDATVVVTSEDGSETRIYTVSFEVLELFIIQDFEDNSTFTDLSGDNGTTSTIVSPPSGEDQGDFSLRMESTSSGLNFQAGYFDQVFDLIYLVDDKRVFVDVYATEEFNLLAKVENGPTFSQVFQPYTTPGQWQRLLFTFDSNANGGEANGVYPRITFFQNSNGTNDGFTGPVDRTIYVDNIAAQSIRNYYIYQDGAWTPENPVSSSTFADNILVVNGETTLNGEVKGGNLQILSGATLNIGPAGVLNLQADIINDGDLIFKSDTDGSGQLAEFNRSISGSGEITSERFIPAGEGPDNGNRAFRYLSSSVTTSGSIFDNWQEEGDYTSQNLGTHITGIQGVVGTYDPTTGLDFTATGNPSMFGFDNDIENWFDVENTKDNGLEAGVPYAIMIRGDRTTDLTTNTPETSNTVLRAKGALQTGSVTKTFNQADSFVLVGNPYQSVVDLKEVDYTGVLDDEFYVWDPRLGDSGNGAYVTVTTNTETPDPSGSDANEFLQPNQAVFMLTEASSPHSITFNENDKATAEPQTEVFSMPSTPYLNMRLYTAARFNTGGQEHDAMGLRFYDEDNIHQFRNAKKLSNSAETMAFIVGDDYASIQHAVLAAGENQFPIYLGSYQHQDYIFWYELENLPDGVTAYLKDDYSEQFTELQQGQNSIAFSVDASVPESMNATRFSIEFDVETFSNNEFDEVTFQLYPNPVDAYLHVNLGGLQAENTEVSIFDITGRKLMQTSYTSSESSIQIDMSNFNTGLYIVEIQKGDQKVIQKILKK